MEPRSSLLNRVLGPSPRIRGEEERSRARLLAVIVLANLGSVILGTLASDFFWRRTLGHSILWSRDGLFLLSCAALLLVSWLVLRLGALHLSTGIYLFSATAFSLIAPFIGHPRHEIALLSTGMIPILIAVIVLPPRWALAYAVALLGAILGELLVLPLTPSEAATGFAILISLLAAGLLLLAVWSHMHNLESWRTFSRRFWAPGADGIALGVRDIDGQRGLDEIVRRSEERYRSLFATVTDAILICDRNEKLIEVNDTAARQLGYTREELLGMHLVSLIPPENASDFRRVQERVAREGHILIEAAQKRKNGSIIPVELAVTHVEMGGEPMFVAVSRDISERRKTEEAHRRMEEQLQHASKMESIGRLAGGVAHDFNNMLTAILGNLEMIAHKQRQGESFEEPLADIREAALSASTLTRHLLAFSRKQVVEPHLVDANELLERMQRMLQRLIGEDVKLRTIKGDGLGTIRVDPNLIEQTIVNLVVNARDAMPGGGMLVIETAEAVLDLEYQREHPLVAPGRYVMFAISDTGTGMSDEVKSHLFEPFFTTKPRGQGTGLGLATSYGAIRQSNGHIAVYSELGKGTTFKIYLPVVNEASQRMVTPSPDEPGTLAAGSETILVVEDDDRVRSLVERSLKSCGYTVLVASHGEEALSLARAVEGKLHLLLTDVVMPGINGRQLAERLAAIHPETRTLFTSGYTENIVVHHGVLDKGIHFISKPYSLEALARRVRSILDG